MTEQVFPAGKIIIFSEGEYSDYGLTGRVVTLCQLDIPAEIAAFKAQFKPTNRYDRPEPDNFVAWLCANQKCAEIEATELWLGSYGELKDKPC